MVYLPPKRKSYTTIVSHENYRLKGMNDDVVFRLDDEKNQNSAMSV